MTLQQKVEAAYEEAEQAIRSGNMVQFREKFDAYLKLETQLMEEMGKVVEKKTEKVKALSFGSATQGFIDELKKKEVL